MLLLFIFLNSSLKRRLETLALHLCNSLSNKPFKGDFGKADLLSDLPGPRRRPQVSFINASSRGLVNCTPCNWPSCHRCRVVMAPTFSYEVDVPESYSALPLEHIKVSNHPEDAPGVTPVVIITLNRPKQRNTFTARMMEDLELVYPRFDVDERVKCIVLTGAGDSFCAGADLNIGFHGLGRTERLVDNRDKYAIRPPTPG